MKAWWFFATTPAPQRTQQRSAPDRSRLSETDVWWARAGERFAAWGERSQQRYHRGLMHY